MASLAPTGSSLQPQLRHAVARVSRAASAVLTGEPSDELPLGSFRTDELRIAAMRLLALLDDAVGTHAARLACAQLESVELALRVLGAIDLHDLPCDARAALATAISVLHADLRSTGDDAVVRAMLDSTPPGADLAALVFDTDPALLDPDAQVSYCQAAQRLESATHARLGAGLVAFSGARPRTSLHPIGGEELALTDARAGELASALSWSSTKAHAAVDTARSLRNDLGSAAQAAATGALQPAALTVIADGARLLTAGIDDAIAAARRTMALDADAEAAIADRVWDLTHARDEMVQQYDNTVSAFAATHTVAETRRKVRDTIARLDPDGFAARRAQAAALESAVAFRALPDAMAMITAVMPSEQATACFRAIDGVARSAPDADAPIGVRRAQALYAFCAHRGATRDGTTDAAADAAHPAMDVVEAEAALRELDVPAAGNGDAVVLSAHAGASPAHASASASDRVLGANPRMRSLSAHVDLVMTLDAFLGLSNTPAECVGAGPIPAEAARALLADAALVTVRRVLVDGRSGRALDVGVQRYQLTDAEREFIRLRDRTCRYPGCNQPAHRCQCDHAVPYEEGGPTRTDNLGVLCVRHHQEKTLGGWAIDASSADGSCEFVSPLGRRYRHAAAPLLPWACDPPLEEEADASFSSDIAAPDDGAPTRSAGDGAQASG